MGVGVGVGVGVVVVVVVVGLILLTGHYSCVISPQAKGG